MDTHVEKINLLSEMIAFSVVDGRLHEREYQFVWIVAQELGISKKDFNELFHQELPTGVIKSEFERIQQFYRLALLMHIDGILHEKEEEAIRQIAINMGLNPSATNRILKLMKASPNAIIPPEVLLGHFQEQHN
ncbi:excinuclease ABC subunit B [Flavobacterium aquariorum]|uniref:Excinuclease ABC subunit B n=1 Tax=Flavobacterium aquariorum TaxID=2217670 RepID=A0A2W7VQ65_9FLAO|nr:TerB family tellurite resistance protein [Flavobacterium aquariorum]PZX94272.1 excinuclease ABC subunit B [Flavobacterium aquariorum]